MLFKITKAPQGDSPQWVRDGWVGVQFKAQQGAPVSMAARAAGSQGKGGIGNILATPKTQSGVSERRGYPTNARDLLGLLALHDPDAARWYIGNAPQMLDPEQIFLVDEGCCLAIAHLSG